MLHVIHGGAIKHDANIMAFLALYFCREGESDIRVFQGNGQVDRGRIGQRERALLLSRAPMMEMSSSDTG